MCTLVQVSRSCCASQGSRRICSRKEKKSRRRQVIVTGAPSTEAARGESAAILKYIHFVSRPLAAVALP